MPTYFIALGIRFYFFSNDHKPFHVHAETGDGKAKFCFEGDDVKLVKNDGMKPKDINLAKAIIAENRENFRGIWDEFFGEEK